MRLGLLLYPISAYEEMESQRNGVIPRQCWGIPVFRGDRVQDLVSHTALAPGSDHGVSLIPKFTK